MVERVGFISQYSVRLSNVSYIWTLPGETFLIKKTLSVSPNPNPDGLVKIECLKKATFLL